MAVAPLAACRDIHFMRMALRLGQRAIGQSWPNPAVGCVIVKDGRVRGRGWTQTGGRPHAEREALDRAGSAARGATAYVTLEPCAHMGKTPPCTNALIEAGIARVVCAIEDPDPRVSGKGIQILREAGVAVTSGVLQAEAAYGHRGFFTACARKRPLVALKVAASLDGKVATRSGDSQWITNPQSRQYSNRLRANYDAILVGSGTLISDDPLLTCRLNGLQHRSPVRIILDTRLRITVGHKVVKTIKDAPVWVVTSAASCEEQTSKCDQLRAQGVRILTAESSGSHLSSQSVLAILAMEGITRVLVEGGPSIATAFLQSGFVDECLWFNANIMIGEDGLSAIQPMGIAELNSSPAFTLHTSKQLDQDHMVHLHAAPGRKSA